MEGHGGSTFLGCASLKILNKLHLLNTDSLLRWCIYNQGNGYKGRPMKPCDSCYSFWVGSVLSMLSSIKNNKNIHNGTELYYNMSNIRYNRIFNLYCQSGFGGFSKLPSTPYGDILHGYMGLNGLALMSKQLKHTNLNIFDGYPNLFKRDVYPITTCTVNNE